MEAIRASTVGGGTRTSISDATSCPSRRPTLSLSSSTDLFPCRTKSLSLCLRVHTGQQTPITNVVKDGDSDISLKDLSQKLQEFADARDWEKYDTPRNLLLAMVGEVGELSEIFQWKGEVKNGLEDWEESEKEHLGEELSDVLLYLIRLADVCGIDLSKASLNKIVKNAIKYPLPPLDHS